MSTAPLDIREIVPGVIALETLFWGKKLNLYLFTGDGSLLCDAGAAGMPTEFILPNLGRIKPPVQLRYLLNAHSHIDHFGGNAEFRRRFPELVILALAKEMELIADHEKQYRIIYDRWTALFQFDEKFHKECIELSGDNVGPDMGLQGDEIVDLGGRAVRVINLPGHSFGDIGVYDAADKVLFSGEALLGEGARNDAGEIVAPPYYENAQDCYTTIQTVQNLDIRYLCTSHFGVLEGEAIQTHLNECLDFFNRYEQDVLAVVKAAGKKGVSAEEAARQYAEKYSPFEFRLETMQLVSTHLDYLEEKGFVRRQQGRFVIADDGPALRRKDMGKT